MTTIKHLFMAFFFLGQLGIFAHAGSEKSIEGVKPNDLSSELLSTPAASIKIASARGFRWAEYCPDETCEVLRVPMRVSAEALTEMTLLYFFYVAEYEYLRAWREKDDLREKLEKFLQLTRPRECNEVLSRALAICVLRNFQKKNAMKILFVRHDEGKVIVQSVDADAQLK